MYIRKLFSQEATLNSMGILPPRREHLRRTTFAIAPELSIMDRGINVRRAAEPEQAAQLGRTVKLERSSSIGFGFNDSQLFAHPSHVMDSSNLRV
jgi:hypothetical protein